MSLLQMSFSGAAFIAAIIFIRAIAIYKLPKKTFFIMGTFASKTDDSFFHSVNVQRVYAYQRQNIHV